MKQDKRFITRFSRAFLAFMFSLILLMLLTLVTIHKTLLDPSFMNQQAKKSDYYEQVASQTVREIQDLGLGSNLPEKALLNSVTEKRVEKDFNLFVRSIYEGKEFSIDQIEFQHSLKQLVLNYAKENKIEITLESDKAIDNFTKEAQVRYVAYIKLPYLSEFGRRMINFKRYMTMAYVVLATSLFLIVALLIWQLGGWWHRLYRYLSYGFIATGMMLIVGPSYLLYKGDINKLAITSKPLYEFITLYLHQFILTFIYLGIASLIVGIFSGILGEQQRRKI